LPSNLQYHKTKTQTKTYIEIPSFPSQNDHHQEKQNKKPQQMLVRMWLKKKKKEPLFTTGENVN
jgi:hypothetical protein